MTAQKVINVHHDSAEASFLAEAAFQRSAIVIYPHYQLTSSSRLILGRKENKNQTIQKQN